MKITEYLEQHKDETAFVTRSFLGTWSISLNKQGNISGRSINSCSQLTDAEIDLCKSLGLRVFDFLDVHDRDAWDAIAIAHSNAHQQFCY